MKQTFLDFNADLRGFDVFSKTTNKQVFRWELYWSGYTIEQIKRDFIVLRRSVTY